MYDLVIKNGKIIDGTGKEGYFSDIAVKDGKIVKIEENITGGKRIINANGLVVAPGFVDSHSHSDVNMIEFPQQTEKVEQGITTSVAGQCGSSVYPRLNKKGETETLGEFLKNSDNLAQGSNTALMVGHNALRKCAMGMENREPAAEELETMKALLRDGLENGAFGVSFGLIYTPSCYAETDELIELAKVASEYNALVVAHIRDEADFLVDAVEEFITIIKASGARGVISHHKAMYKQNHGKVVKTLEMIKKANEDGFEIYCDVYPYIASSTTIEARFIPSEYRKGGSKVVEVLNDPEKCREIKELNLKKWGSDLSWVMVKNCKAYPEYEGKTMDEIAKIHGKDEYETVFDILRNSGGTSKGIYFSMSEEDVERVLSYPGSMICTDSEAAAGNKLYHPRLRGSFPRVLGRYVRERNVTSLEEMIRKMTSLPAFVYGLENKGKICEGFDGDICIFDPDKIIDRSEYTDCTKGAEGLEFVIVNGKIAAENAVYNGAMSGKVIKKGK